MEVSHPVFWHAAIGATSWWWGATFGIKHRIYLDDDGKITNPAPDADLWKQCWQCGLIVGVYEAVNAGELFDSGLTALIMQSKSFSHKFLHPGEFSYFCRVHPTMGTTSLGVYRFWRDMGFVFGAIGIGYLADLFGLNSAIQLVAFLAVGSGIFVLVIMKETINRESFALP